MDREKDEESHKWMLFNMFFIINEKWGNSCVEHDAESA